VYVTADIVILDAKTLSIYNIITALPPIKLNDIHESLPDYQKIQ
jgi:hypothetical protein